MTNIKLFVIVVRCVVRRFFLLHDLLVLDLQQVPEVLLDRRDGVLLTHHVGGFLGNHHLCRV